MKTQTFGIELETTGLGRARTAQVLAEHFGTVDRHVGLHLDNWTVPMPDGRRWTVESDASVTDPDAEVVSPVCRWEDIPMVQEVVRALRRAGAMTDESCGIHIHVGAERFTAKTLRNLVNIMASKEDMIYRALQINPSRESRYCRKTNTAFLKDLNRKKPVTLDGIAELWYQEAPYGRNHHYNSTRYHGLNLHATFTKGTVEFRLFNGTLHAGEIKAYIQFCLAVAHQALTQKKASARKTETDNEKYAFRCWMLRLGLIGDEFKTCRLHFLKHLTGNSAWRNAAA